MGKINTGIYIDERVKDKVEECARETAKRYNLRPRQWGFSNQVESMLAKDLGINLTIEPVMLSPKKPSSK